MCETCFIFEANRDLTVCATDSAVNRGKSLYKKSHLCSPWAFWLCIYLHTITQLKPPLCFSACNWAITTIEGGLNMWLHPWLGSWFHRLHSQGVFTHCLCAFLTFDFFSNSKMEARKRTEFDWPKKEERRKIEAKVSCKFFVLLRFRYYCANKET